MTLTYAAYKRPTSEQKTYRKVKDWKVIFLENRGEKAGVAILI